MMFNFVRSTTFLIFRAISSVSKCRVSLFPTVAILRYSRVHIGTSNGGNIVAVVERMINKEFSFGPILRVLYI